MLNEKQRVAKRRLIAENRERRKQEQAKLKVKHDQCSHDNLTEEDRALINDIVSAYDLTAGKCTQNYVLVSLLLMFIDEGIRNKKCHFELGQSEHTKRKRVLRPSYALNSVFLFANYVMKIAKVTTRMLKYP